MDSCTSCKNNLVSPTDLKLMNSVLSYYGAVQVARLYARLWCRWNWEIEFGTPPANQKAWTLQVSKIQHKGRRDKTVWPFDGEQESTVTPCNSEIPHRCSGGLRSSPCHPETFLTGWRWSLRTSLWPNSSSLCRNIRFFSLSHLYCLLLLFPNSVSACSLYSKLEPAAAQEQDTCCRH